MEEKELIEKLLRAGLDALLKDKRVTVDEYQYAEKFVESMLKEIGKVK